MSLTDIEQQTLLLFANHGPLTGYDLHSKKKGDGSREPAESNIMSDVYWLKVRNKLLDHGFITEFPEEGRRKPYILGVDGFDYVIRTQLQEITDFDNFVEIYQMYFPLVFGVWGMLSEHGLVDYVLATLGGNVEMIYVDVFRDFRLGRLFRYSHQEFIEDLYARIYLPELFRDEADLRAVPVEWIGDFRRDVSEIRAFVLGYLGDQKKTHMTRYRKIEQLEKSIT